MLIDVPKLLISLFTSTLLVFAFVGLARAQADGAEAVPLGSAELTAFDANGVKLQLPMLKTTVAASIQGTVASVQVVQRFRNPTDHRIEARYRMPLPEQSAVFGMQIVFPDRMIEGEIQERDQARVNYEAAKAGGFRTALVEQHRENLFDTKVAGIDPGTEVEIRLQFWQPIQYADGIFSWHFPLTLRERAEVRSTNDVSAMIDAMDHRIGVAGATETATLSIQLDAGMPIDALQSPSHEITVEDRGALWIQPKLAAVPMTRDFVLQWRAKTGANPALSVLRERVGAFEYVLTTIAPPQQSSATVPRELIVVVDSSGSMQGQAWQAALSAVNKALDGLRAGDRFNLVDFDDAARTFSSESLIAETTNIGRAREWLASATADGGTNIQAGLVSALDMPAAPGFLRQVVFITDGAVGNEAEIYAELVQQEQQPARPPASIFTIGVGSAPNRAFLRKTADFGRGVSVIVESAESLEGQMQKLMDKLNAPQVVGLAANFSADAEVYPRVFPDLYLGEPITIVARMPVANASKSLQVTGRFGASAWQHTLPMPVAKSINASNMPNGGIAKLWARRKISQLEDDEALSSYAINNKSLIIETALEHRLLSRYTSFVAIEKRPAAASGNDLVPVDFANATPDDQDFAATAIGWQAQALLGGLLSIFGALMLGVQRWRTV
jgi:Ca-activated chloride channel homolog